MSDPAVCLCFDCKKKIAVLCGVMFLWLLLLAFPYHAHIPFAHPALNSLEAAGVDVQPYLDNATLRQALFDDWERRRAQS